ncbi:MAG TPA: peptide ABC transporter substrate-binding protein [Oscillospiraceae bacterium]|nr:peptide ABC transporter substrate-binding protein [Oscillospiraceae bacterium]
MKFKALLLAALMVVLPCFSGCSTVNSTMGFDIRAALGTYDPQLASDESTLLIIENCFEGLLKKDADGNIIGGAAKEWEVSEDGLTYTFTLRNDLMWSDGETALTADDFVFAFHRLFEKQTGAPLRSDFISMSGAEEILYENADVSRLGISAPDEHTVVIKLAYPDALFPELLTTAAASPCNEAFFDGTRGRYGQNLDYILFNGPYYVRRVNSSYYVLSPNPSYHGGNLFYQDIYVYVRDEEDYDPYSRLTEEKIDGAVADYTDLSALYDSGFRIGGTEDTLWILLFNEDDGYFASKNIRRAFAYAADKSLMEAALPGNLRIADAYVPGAVTIGGISYREQAGDSFVGFGYDADFAGELLKDGLAELGSENLPTLSILCPEEFLGVMGYLQKSIQENLATFVNLVPASEEEISAAVSSGTYQIALVSRTPQYNNPSAILSGFVGTDETGADGTVSSAPDFGAVLRDAADSGSFSESVGNYALAEEMLLQEMPALPVFYETSYFAGSGKITGLSYSPFGGHIRFEYCR